MNATLETTPRFGCFVTGTDTGVGKTLCSAAILHALKHAGARAAGMKPVAAGAVWRDGGWRNEDTDLLMAEAGVALPQALVTPLLLREPAAPHIAAALEDVTIDPTLLLDRYAALAERVDAVVVEGVGGFRVPLVDGFDMADFAQRLGLPVVMVVGLRLGCLSHALLTAEAIEARGLALAGWIGNTIDPAMPHLADNIATLRRGLPAPLLGVVPHLPASGASMAAAAAEALDCARLPGWPGTSSAASAGAERGQAERESRAN